MKALLVPFATLAGVGLVLSATVHVASLAGVALFGGYAYGLHAGVFVVWFPAVIVSQRHARKVKRKDIWKVVLRGCPSWLRFLTYGFFAYAMLNFGYFFITIAGGPKQPGAADTETLRLFSGHWMAFYAAALSILYSATRIESLDAQRTP